MFSQTWRKYVPLIRLFIKKAGGGEQKIQLNKTDFERALGGRKLKLSFSRLEINRGRMNNMLPNTVLAKDLADVLLDDQSTAVLLQNRNISFSFTGDMELIINDETPAAAAVEEATTDEAQPAADNNESAMPE
jgi:hypothetical protein